MHPGASSMRGTEVYTRSRWYHRWWVQIAMAGGSLLVLLLFCVVVALVFGWVLITLTSALVG